MLWLTSVTMNYMTISFDELSALSGLSYLPQLIYIHGIKPYIDFKSGIVGIKRGISYQSIAEALYIEPHSGIASGSPTKSQIRRALKSLERVGIINIQSLEKKLIIQCCLATLGYSVQKQVITNPTHETVTKESVYKPVAPSDLENLDLDPDIAKTAQVIIPLKDNNYIYIYFEKFWELYPLKKSKQKALANFLELSPSAELLSEMTDALQKQINFHNQQCSRGVWMPPWKYPENWLVQQCWQDVVDTKILIGETDERSGNANKSGAKRANKGRDLLWESCAAGVKASFDWTASAIAKANETISRDDSCRENATMASGAEGAGSASSAVRSASNIVAFSQS